MGAAKFQVVFEGQLSEGADRRDVIEKLAKTFKIEPSQVEIELFCGGPVVVRKDLSHTQAKEYLDMLISLGGLFRIEPQPQADDALSFDDLDLESELGPDFAQADEEFPDADMPDLLSSEAPPAPPTPPMPPSPPKKAAPTKTAKTPPPSPKPARADKKKTAVPKKGAKTKTPTPDKKSKSIFSLKGIKDKAKQVDLSQTGESVKERLAEAAQDIRDTGQKGGAKALITNRYVLIGAGGILVICLALYFLFGMPPSPPKSFLNSPLRSVYSGGQDDGTQPLEISLAEFVAAIQNAELRWEEFETDVWILHVRKEEAGHKITSIRLLFERMANHNFHKDVLLKSVTLNGRRLSYGKVYEYASQTGAEGFQKRVPKTLGEAVTKKDLAALHSLLKKKPPAKDLNGALFAAAGVGFSEAIAPLVKAGADLNALNDQGANLLETALHTEHFDLVAALLAHPLNQAVKDSALIEAVAKARLDMCRALVEAGADPNVTDADGRPPLLSAIAGQQADLALGLLDLGADVNFRTTGNQPQTALGLALEHKLIGVALGLVEKGADVRLPFHYGPALLMAIDMESAELVEALIEKGAAVDTSDAADPSLLIRAVQKKSLPLVALFLEKGVPANQRGKNGTNALLEAVRAEDQKIAKALLDAGADPNQMDDQELSAMDLAVGEKQAAMVSLLKNAGGIDYIGQALAQVVGKYPNSEGLQAGVITVHSISGQTMTFSIKTFQIGGCEVAEKRAGLQYNPTSRMYEGQFKDNKCVLTFNFERLENGKPWYFSVYQDGPCPRYCSKRGVIGGEYYKRDDP